MLCRGNFHVSEETNGLQADSARSLALAPSSAGAHIELFVMSRANHVFCCTAVLFLTQACSGKVGGTGLAPADTSEELNEDQRAEPTSPNPEQPAAATNLPAAAAESNLEMEGDNSAATLPSSTAEAEEDSPPNTTEAQRSETCVAPPGVNASPRNYGEFAALINSLPLPTTLECFVSSLRRPLGLFATFGAASAQPARGIRSPRTFLFSGPFIYSVVPDEQDGNVLEFSFLVSPNRSVKGELEFPLLKALDSDEMDRRLNPDEFGNVCGGCHRPEVAFNDEFYVNAFESSVLEPDVGLNASLATVQGLWESCDSEREPLRCGLFNAIFEHGSVRAEDFSDAVYARGQR